MSTKPTETTIPVTTLADHIEQVDGVVSLRGDSGGTVRITGDVSSSSAMPGCTLIETEVGTLYIGDEEDVTIIEE